MHIAIIGGYCEMFCWDVSFSLFHSFSLPLLLTVSIMWKHLRSFRSLLKRKEKKKHACMVELWASAMGRESERTELWNSLTHSLTHNDYLRWWVLSRSTPACGLSFLYFFSFYFFILCIFFFFFRFLLHFLLCMCMKSVCVCVCGTKKVQYVLFLSLSLSLSLLLSVTSSPGWSLFLNSLSCSVSFPSFLLCLPLCCVKKL